MDVKSIKLRSFQNSYLGPEYWLLRFSHTYSKHLNNLNPLKGIST